MNRYKTLLVSLGLLGVLGACTAADRDYVPSPFQDEGGIAEQSPSSFAGNYLAGRQAFREKDADIAAEYFDDALLLQPGDDILLQNAFQVSLAKGDMERALELAKQIQGQNTDNNDAALLVLTIDRIRAEDFKAAGEFLEKTKASGFNVLLKPVLNAWVLQGGGDIDGAVKALDDLDKFEGFKVLKSYHRALLYHVHGQADKARAQYEKAIEGPAGRAVRLVQSYGVFLLEQGEREKAVELFTDYQKEFPQSPTANRLLDDLRANKEIAPLMRNAIEGAAEALYSSATIVGQDRAKSVAATYAYFSLMLKPDMSVASALLAEIFEDQQKWERSLSYYEKVPDSSPYAFNAKTRASWIIYRMGDADTAIRRLEVIAKDNPSEIEPLVVLADIYRDLKRWRDAANAYGRAIDNAQDAKGRLWSLHYARGIAYERMKSWEKAETDLLEALKLRPDHPQVLNYLGYSWVDRGTNLEEAKGMLIKAVSLRPRDGYIIDSLGWLYFRLNEFENATEQLEKAVSLTPEDPTINDHLGDAYWRVGRFGEARYQWQRALWLDPEEDQRLLIEDKLKTGLPALAPQKK